MVQVKV